MVDKSMLFVALSGEPGLRDAAIALVEEYLWLPDAWRGSPPSGLPSALHRELSDFPGNATPPTGEVIVGLEAGLAASVGVLRPVSATVVEMKRMYVRPESRGRGIGRGMVERLIATALSLGYAQIVLDVMTERISATGLYLAAGFAPIDAYKTYPDFDVPLTTLGLDLRSRSAAATLSWPSGTVHRGTIFE